jgi:hypothetical protein
VDQPLPAKLALWLVPQPLASRADQGQAALRLPVPLAVAKLALLEIAPLAQQLLAVSHLELVFRAVAPQQVPRLVAKAHRVKTS